MNTSFSTITCLSFGQWLDNRLCQDAQAYFNTSSRLYYQPDTRLGAGHVAYASPFRSWVHDSGVSGALIGGTISGTLGLGGTGQLAGGQSGMVVDYVNGRVIFPASVGKTAIISGSYAVKELNVYFPNTSAERMVFTDKYYLNSRFARPITGLPPPYDMVTPCVFVTDTAAQNEPWALGGLYATRRHLSCYVMAENPTQLQGALSSMADAQDAVFPQLPPEAWPLGPSGSLKGGSGYNWEAIKGQYGQVGNLYWVREVRVSKIGDGQGVDQSVWLGMADFTVDRVRTIR
jgi:hypothetical protein